MHQELEDYKRQKYKLTKMTMTTVERKNPIQVAMSFQAL